MGVGLRGRPRKPTALKLVDGNPGNRPIPKNEPKPPEVDPSKPKHVTADRVASEEWDRLVALTTAKGARVLTVADGPMLEATVLAYADWHESRDAVREFGAVYETTTPSGAIMFRPRPEVAQRNDAWKRYVSGLTHFGLSPATRGKVKAIGDGGDELDAMLRGKGSRSGA